MYRIVYFDISAIVFTTLLLIFSIRRKMYKGSSSRLYICFILLTLITSVCSLLTAMAGNDVNFLSVNARYSLHTVYIIMRIWQSVMYLIYIISLADSYERLRSNTAYCLVFVPCLVMTALALTNSFSHKMFYIDDALVYQRGEWFWLMYVNTAFYCVVSLLLIVEYKKLLGNGAFLSLAMVFPITVCAVAIQFFYPQFMLEMFAMSLSIFLISNTVQKPEDMLDVESGLLNGTSYNKALEKGFYNKVSFGVVIINITNHNNLYAMLGYKRSNEIIRSIGNVIEQLELPQKIYTDKYYLSDGRFRVICRRCSSSSLRETATIINDELRKGIQYNNMEIHLLANVCEVFVPFDIKDYDTLSSFEGQFDNFVEYSGTVFRASDILNKHSIYNNSELDIIIEDAIANHKFEVYYQPIYSVKEQRFCSAEALLRLKSEKYGFIPPNVFIERAERSGAIHRIGNYVVSEVADFIASEEFEKTGLDYIEVNLSVSQCMNRGLADDIIRILKDRNVDFSKINLEITETAASVARNTLMDNLNKLSIEGIAFSLDDYGTGYSNLERVSSLPVDIVKLDKTFVEVVDNPRMKTVINNTVKMMKELDMGIVIEGVETKDVLKTFIELGCDYVQGYYFSKPIPKKEFVEFLQANM